MPVHFSPSRSLKYCFMTLRTASESSLSRPPVSARLSDLLGCKCDLFVVVVFELARTAHELVEKLRHRLELRLRIVEGVHARAEHRRVRKALGVPADVLARHPHASLPAVERVQLVQVLHHDLADL